MGFDGDNCDKCAPEYLPTRPPPELGCSKNVTSLCRPDSCGCKVSNAAVCDPIGVCSVEGELAKCKCPSNFNGAKCELVRNPSLLVYLYSL